MRRELPRQRPLGIPKLPGNEPAIFQWCSTPLRELVPNNAGGLNGSMQH